jgi:hypothetical protein
MLIMHSIRRAVSRTLVASALVVGAAACSDKFLAVTNPDVIDAATVDPTSGAATLAASSQQNFATAVGWLSMYSGWFSGEANVSDTFPTRNEFGFRLIVPENGSLLTDVWRPISLAAASSKIVLDLTLPNPTTNINTARAAAFRGFSVLYMATDFCIGTLSSGPALTTAQMLDTAIFWFGRAIDVGTANASADGIALANASRVGRARAKLQKGDNAGAATDAAATPAGFVFNLKYTDDLNNRTRLGNRLYQFSFDRGAISVAPAFRVTNDPRLTYNVPGTTTAQAFDPVPGGFFQQTKYFKTGASAGYDAPIRLASKLEADYIAAEASGDAAAMLTLINARRTANNQAVYAGATDKASVMTELYNQRGIEFYLEGRRLADFRRSPSSVSNITPAGAAYFKPGYSSTGTQTCYPLPRQELDNNPNLKTP